MAFGSLDAVLFNPTAGGTTDWTYSSAVTGYQSPAAAGATNSVVYYYRAYSSDLTQWEEGYGAWNSGTSVLARTTVLFNSAGNTSKINFTNPPFVAIVAPTAFFTDAASILSGLIAQARLGTGSGGSGLKALFDDQTYKTVSQTEQWLAGSNFSGLSEVDFTNLDTTNYKYFIIRIRGLTFSSGTPATKIQAGTGATPTWQTSGYDTVYSNGATDGYYNWGITSGAGPGASIDFRIGYDLSATGYKSAIWQDYRYNNGGSAANSGVGAWLTTTALTALRILLAATANGGRVDIYGVRAS